MTSMRRKLSSASLFGLSIGLVLVGALASRAADYVDGPAGLALLVVGLTAILASLVAVYLHWKRLDEAAREAHKAAWYWGGSGGLAVGGLLVGYLMANPEADLSRYAAGPGDAGLMLTGSLVVVTAQLVGYVVVWAWWWWSRR